MIANKYGFWEGGVINSKIEFGENTQLWIHQKPLKYALYKGEFYSIELQLNEAAFFKKKLYNSK